MKNKPKRNKQKGDKGENIARQFLENLGYTFIEKNYSSSYGEIDLIFKDRSTLVFVEVKTRDNENFIKFEEIINDKKTNRILKTAENYIENTEIVFDETRIDAVFIILSDGERKLKHLKNYY